MRRLEQLRREMMQQIDDFDDEMNKKFDVLERGLGEMTGNAHRLVCEHNEAVAVYNHGCNGGDRFLTLRKIVPGNGPGLLSAASRRVSIPLLPELQIGDTIPRRFWSRNCNELQWTLDQIDDLSRLMNQDFGIEATDDLATCRRKLHAFATSP